jgi:hypothetical protein
MPNPLTARQIAQGAGPDTAPIQPARDLFPPIAGAGKDRNTAGVTGDNTSDGPGVLGQSASGAGVEGKSTGHDGVRGITQHKDHAGVAGVNAGGGIGIYGKGAIAGFFEGSVTMTGDLTMANGTDIRLSDFAEDFDVAEKEDIEPGTVVIFDRKGALQRSHTAYDKRVAGVISGAGNFRPAITLDRCKSAEYRLPVALVGKVYCKVDADILPIEVGDLLTTSSTPGHAMKADDNMKAFGSVIGKALRPLEAGKSLIPILIALQ